MRRLVIALVSVSVLTGCTGGADGSDDGDGGKADPSTSSTNEPTGPSCADVWKAGETLPDDYKSCLQDGVTAEQEVYECIDGSKLVAFADTMYAVTGGEILKPDAQPFQDTAEYGEAYSTCTGE